MTQITTYATLKTAVGEWGTFDQTAMIPTFVDWAHQEICRRLRCNTMLTSTSITLDAETESLPARFASLRRIYLDTTPRRTLVVVSPEQAQERIGLAGSVTYPDSVAIEGSSFRFAPAFSGSATAYILYYQKPATMTADADTNTVLTAYPMLYLWGALEALYRYMEDDIQADRYGGMFGALIEDINNREARDVMSGPLYSQPTFGQVI